MYSANNPRSPPPSNTLNADTKMFSDGQRNPQRAHLFGYDGLPHGSHYAVHDMRSIPMASNELTPPLRSPNPIRTHSSTHSHSHSRLKAKDTRRRSIGSSKSEERGDGSAAVRRRISRACDQCNQLRTKCDGGTRCSHCVGGFQGL